jgi:branched-chain amino acid aminotransferase
MMHEPSPIKAWHNGEFIDAASLHVGVDDAGFRQGVIAVERLRTYGLHVSALNEHIVRWRRTLEELYLNVAVDVDEIADRILRLLDENRSWTDVVGDCGIVMLATPGTPRDKANGMLANEMMHLIPIDHAKVQRHRNQGQPLFITDVEQPGGKCWPRDIKVRCRLHYYLADQQARDHHGDAVGLLIDHDGTVTETSVANIAIVKHNEVISPPADQVLPGITQMLTQRACAKAKVPWKHERLWPAEIREADEVWLMGTDGGLWFVNRVDGAPVGGGGPGIAYQTCQKLFDNLVTTGGLAS